MDLIIKNGRVIDGTGGSWFKADIGVVGEKIAKIGHLADVPAQKVVDAGGHYVCPGFIDIHSHTDLLCTLPRERKTQLFKGRITQGITNGNQRQLRYRRGAPF